MGKVKAFFIQESAEDLLKMARGVANPLASRMKQTVMEARRINCSGVPIH